jgi:hypothetical protein
VIEHCDHCQALAPRWDAPDYGDWHLALTDHGEYLGVVCGECFAGEGLVFIGVQRPAASRRARAVDRAGWAGSLRGPAIALTASAAGAVLRSGVSLLGRLRLTQTPPRRPSRSWA